jgi:hypothetical protein
MPPLTKNNHHCQPCRKTAKDGWCRKHQVCCSSPSHEAWVHYRNEKCLQFLSADTVKGLPMPRTLAVWEQIGAIVEQEFVPMDDITDIYDDIEMCNGQIL